MKARSAASEESTGHQPLENAIQMHMCRTRVHMHRGPIAWGHVPLVEHVYLGRGGDMCCGKLSPSNDLALPVRDPRKAWTGLKGRCNHLSVVTPRYT